jgi:hypothetical protein
MRTQIENTREENKKLNEEVVEIKEKWPERETVNQRDMWLHL